jgi:hypothetical protein
MRLTVVELLLGLPVRASLPADMLWTARELLPYLPNHSGYHKRLKAAGAVPVALDHLVPVLDGHNQVWLIDATPTRRQPLASASNGSSTSVIHAIPRLSLSTTAAPEPVVDHLAIMSLDQTGRGRQRWTN